MKTCSWLHFRAAAGIAALMFMVQMAIAQSLPNGGFELWTNGNPDNWKTTNTPPLIVNVTQSTDAHGGSSSMACSTVDYLGTPFPPVVVAGSDGKGFAINFRPAALHGWYKFVSVGGDQASINIGLSMSAAHQAVGGGLNPVISATTNIYTEFVKDIFYFTADIPDTANISITTTTAGTYHIGTILTIDDLSWGPTSDVKEVTPDKPSIFVLEQNYPNPFNPSTNIEFQVPDRSLVTIKVFDILGREMTTLVNEDLAPGRYRVTLDGSSMASGTYLYRLTAGGVTLSKRLMLVR